MSDSVSRRRRIAKRFDFKDSLRINELTLACGPDNLLVEKRLDHPEKR